MTEQQLIKELDEIIAFYDVAKAKATGLRKKLERTSGKRPTKLSDEVIAEQ